MNAPAVLLTVLSLLAVREVWVVARAARLRRVRDRECRARLATVLGTVTR